MPFDLPYSLDGSRYGRIEYKSKAEVLFIANLSLMIKFLSRFSFPIPTLSSPSRRSSSSTPVIVLKRRRLRWRRYNQAQRAACLSEKYYCE